jgi:hypothetical protein
VSGIINTKTERAFTLLGWLSKKLGKTKKCPAFEVAAFKNQSKPICEKLYFLFIQGLLPDSDTNVRHIKRQQGSF